jgi:DNA-binding MarR family transcriptional regulator
MSMQAFVKEKEGDGFTDIQGPAWAGFLRMQAQLLRRLNAELQANHGITLSEYEVLLFLDWAPQSRLPISTLASSVFLSLSGVSRLVDRLVRDGYVQREASTQDSRVSYAVLTQAGLEKRRAAQPTHLNGVRQHFLSHFSNEELLMLARFWERIEPSSSSNESKEDVQSEAEKEAAASEKEMRGRGRPRKGGPRAQARKGLEVTFDVRTIALLDAVTDNKSEYLEKLVLERLRERKKAVDDELRRKLEERYRRLPGAVVGKLQELANLAGVAAAYQASEAIMLLLEQDHHSNAKYHSFERMD